ncbi:MAG TPA: hypothetical protein VMY42_02800 [Thermoguttaceae bacterium]|nr:hypothetical protein [Thermoguttaceae bacterium]
MSNPASFELVMIDFAREFELHPLQALVRIQLLLLDEYLCRKRIEFLKGVAPRSAGHRGRSEDARFQHSVNAIIRFGVIDAVEGGHLDAWDLHTLTCNPDGVWQGHIAAVAALSPSDGNTSEPGLTEITLQGDWDKLRARLREYFPAVAEFVGIPGYLFEAALENVVERSHALAQSRFRDALPQWLADFAEVEGLQLVRQLTTQAWEEILDKYVRGVVCRQLIEERSRPVDWLRAFVSAVADAPTWKELPDVTLPACLEPTRHFPGFCEHVSELASSTYERAACFFELKA